MLTTTRSRYDVDEVKRSADGRWDHILSATCGIDPELLDGKKHPCPKCGGTDRFRWDRGKEFAICNQCFKKENGDGLAAMMWLLECDFQTALATAADYVGLAQNHNDRAVQVDVIEAVARAKSVPVEAFKAFGVAKATRYSVSAKQETSVARFPTYNELGERNSYFDIWASGNDSERKGKNEKGAKAGLFFPDNGRLPADGETWLIVEGPKDAALLYSLGYKNAVGLNTGHMAAKFGRLFRGIHVVIIGDLDTAGESGARKTAGSLYGIGGAASVKIARLPGEIVDSGGDDVRDVHRKYGAGAIRDAIDAAIEWQPNPTLKSSGEPREIRRCTDMGNAERFTDQHGHNARYCWEWSKWLIWDGRRWQIDTGAAVDDLAQRTVRTIYEEAANSKDGDQRSVLAKWAMASEKRDRVAALITMARSKLPISPDELDRDPWLLNVNGGTIDLRTGKRRGHDRDDFITKLAPVTFDPDAECPTWHLFLDRIFGGNRDLIYYVRNLVGYALTGAIRDHILPVFYGKGANGKSTLIGTIMDLMGNDYSMKASPDTLMIKRHESHPTERADLFGMRLVAAIETEEGRRLAESLVKELTGGDKIRARRMREDFWQFDPTHKVWLACNHKPVIRGTDNAIWRRIRLVPFEVTIPDHEQDKDLPIKLRAELSGILNWALLGAVEWFREGLQEPADVLAATSSYRNEMDQLVQFVADECIENPEALEGSSKLFERYKAWCERNGERCVTQKRFSMSLEERGIEDAGRDPSSGLKLRRGLFLRSNSPEMTEAYEANSG